MDVQHLNARDDEIVKPRTVHERWCDDWAYISLINRVLSSCIICAKVEMDAYLEGHVSWSHSVSIEVIHLRNDVMYFSETWCSRL